MYYTGKERNIKMIILVISIYSSSYLYMPIGQLWHLINCITYIWTASYSTLFSIILDKHGAYFPIKSEKFAVYKGMTIKLAMVNIGKNLNMLNDIIYFNMTIPHSNIFTISISKTADKLKFVHKEISIKIYLIWSENSYYLHICYVYLIMICYLDSCGNATIAQNTRMANLFMMIIFLLLWISWWPGMTFIYLYIYSGGHINCINKMLYLA